MKEQRGDLNTVSPPHRPVRPHRRRTGFASVSLALAIFALATGAPLAAATVQRLAGADRFATAAAVSAATFAPGVSHAFVATGANYPDALAAAAAAGKRAGPVLLVSRTSVPASTMTELRRLRPGAIVIAGGTAVVSNTVAQTLGSVAPVAAVGVDQRPYTAASAWNTPIASNAVSDSRSREMVATIGQSGNGGVITSDPAQYTFPVYFAAAGTPRYDVPCKVYRCTVVTASGTTTTSVLKGVPIPVGARPSAGTDAQMIIIDPATGAEYDLWQASFAGGGWSVSNASVYNVRWDGMPTRYGSRGAGVPYYAGLIRPWEIAAGRIDHAIAFAYPGSASRGCVWPASKTDGKNSGGSAIPEGARLQLDPRMTEADFTALGLDRTGKIIARALQRYGMILIDVSGRPKIYAENLSANPFTATSWSNANTKLTSSTISSLPYTAFRVLDLPDAYWTGGTGPLHGSCNR